MKNQKGFIQIPILIAIIVSAIVFGGGGYLIAHKKAPKVSTESNVAITTEQTTKTEELSVESKKTTSEEVPKNTTPKKETSGASTQVKVETPPIKTEIVLPVAKSFKEPVLSAINAQIDSYKAITKWIDNDMMPALSQRESMLNGLISSTNSLMASESDSSVDYAYSLFIEAYNLDKSQVVVFYRGIFSDIKNHINNEKISALNSEYSKFSAKSSVSETEYNSEIQVLAEYQSYWQKLYDGGVKLAMTQFMSQTDTKDQMYKNLWSQLSIAVSDLKKTQALQSSLSQLYAQQVKPINCSFSSHFDGFGTVGSINCY